MRFFIKAFLFLIVGAISFYGFSWYENKKEVDNIIVNGGGSYRSTYIDLNGDSITNGIRFPIPGSSDTVTVEQVRIGTGNLLTNIKLGRAFSKEDISKLPKRFDFIIDLKKIKMPIPSDMMDSEDGDNIMPELVFAGCDNKKSLSYDDITSFGVDEIIGDIKVVTTVDTLANNLKADLYLSADKMNITKAVFNIKNFNLDNPFNMALGGGFVEITDSGLHKNIIDMCAKKKNMSVKEYTDRHIAYLKHYFFQENTFLSSDFYEQYAQYITNPRNIKFKFLPSDSLQAMSFGNMSHQALMRKLNLELYINDKPVQQLYGNRPDPSELPQLDIEAPEEEIQYVHGLTIQPTAVNQMGKYIDYYAFFNYRGKKYKGRIQSVSGGTVIVKYELTAGNIIAKPFAMKDISNLKIRREFSTEAKDGAEKVVKKNP